MGSPVWSRDGMIAVGNAHKDKVKLTFSHGASLPDPDKLFNNGFGGKVWRAIDVSEGEEIDADALKELVRAAIAYNRAKKKPARAKSAKAKGELVQASDHSDSAAITLFNSAQRRMTVSAPASVSTSAWPG